MADCIFHGYSGEPGPCKECAKERAQGLEQGSIIVDADTIKARFDMADQNSVPTKKRRNKRCPGKGSNYK